MGDNNFTRRLQKHAGRAKEIIRQNIGKADKTTDEDFEEYVKNFQKQQNASLRLSKEVKNYYSCVRALQIASKGLMDVVSDLYEPNWIECDKVQVKASLLEKKWDNYIERMNDQVMGPLVAYSDQFSDIHNKILKRRRKLLDFDSSRHTVQGLEQSKKKEETKLSKARAELDEKKSLYDVINSELLIELPALYDSRISFLASNMQSLFVAEASFHGGTAKIFGELNDAVESLASQNQSGIYSSRKMLTQENVAYLQESLGNIDEDKKGQSSASKSSSSVYYTCESGQTTSEESIGSNKGKSPKQNSTGASAYSAIEANASKNAHKPGAAYPTCETGSHASDTESAGSIDSVIQNPDKVDPSGKRDMDKKQSGPKEFGDAALSAPEASSVAVSVESISGSNLPDAESVAVINKVLYKVEATYPYAAEDNDELSFDTGEIINVFETNDPDLQEDGWLYGQKASGGSFGMFPENFTKKL